MAAELARSMPAAVNRLPIGALLAASAISNVGNMLTMIALPWFVLETTGSAAMTGVVGFFVALPNFLAGVFGGTLVDRLGYKRVSVISDLVSGFGVLMVPLLFLTVGLAFWQLLVFVFIGALLDIPGITARRAMIPELAKQGGLRLEQANSAFESLQYVALLLGPPLAGVLIGVIGAENVLWLDAATFVASAGLVALAVPAPSIERTQAAAGRYLDELMAGLRFLRGERLLFTLAVAVGIANFIGAGLVSVLLPVFAQRTYGEASTLGLMMTGFGIGALGGAVVFGAFGHRLPRRAIWLTAFLVDPIMIWPLLVTDWLPALLSCIVVGAFFSGPINALMVTIRHERIPIELRGRVFSTFSAITAVATPLGILLTGYAIEHLGLRSAILIVALGVQALAVAMFFVPAFHEMDATRPEAEAA